MQNTKENIKLGDLILKNMSINQIMEIKVKQIIIQSQKRRYRNKLTGKQFQINYKKKSGDY